MILLLDRKIDGGRERGGSKIEKVIERKTEREREGVNDRERERAR